MPIVNAIIVYGSKTKTRAKTTKYKRKKNPEESPPVENTNKRIIVFKINIPSGPPKEICFPFFVVARELTTYTMIKNPIIGRV